MYNVNVLLCCVHAIGRPLLLDSSEKLFSDAKGHGRVLLRRRPCPEGSCAEPRHHPLLLHVRTASNVDDQIPKILPVSTE